jgi:hypothetical protein
MDPEAKQFLNSLKCPLCGSLIDLISWDNSATNKRYNFGCRYNAGHYAMWYVHWPIPRIITHDHVNVYQGNKRYSIEQRYCPDLSWSVPEQLTQLWIHRVDPEHRILEEFLPDYVEFDQIVFDWQKLNESQILNKVKTLLTFQ